MSYVRTSTADVGRGYHVTFTLRDGALDVVWSPRVPVGRRGRQLLPAYREARNAFLADVAAERGIVIAVAEI
jgi:hypothetical protein